MVSSVLNSLFAQSENQNRIDQRVISKQISIDSLRRVEFLEDLLDSFPKKEYYIYYCYITRSGKGFITTTGQVDNTHPNRRSPIISTLFETRDRPVKPGQKYLFDRIHIRKFKDKNDSEPYPPLELIITE